MKLPLRVGVGTAYDSKVRAGSHGLNDTNIAPRDRQHGGYRPGRAARRALLSEGDDQSRAQVTMIGNDLASHLFPGVDPIGHELLIEGRPS